MSQKPEAALANTEVLRTEEYLVSQKQGLSGGDQAWMILFFEGFSQGIQGDFLKIPHQKRHQF